MVLCSLTFFLFVSYSSADEKFRWNNQGKFSRIQFLQTFVYFVRSFGPCVAESFFIKKNSTILHLLLIDATFKRSRPSCQERLHLKSSKNKTFCHIYEPHRK